MHLLLLTNACKRISENYCNYFRDTHFSYIWFPLFCFRFPLKYCWFLCTIFIKLSCFIVFHFIDNVKIQLSGLWQSLSMLIKWRLNIEIFDRIHWQDCYATWETWKSQRIWYLTEKSGKSQGIWKILKAWSDFYPTFLKSNFWVSCHT